MIVCVCRRVSDRTVAAALEAGARSAEDVARATGAGTSCGCCVPTVEAIVHGHAASCAVPCASCPRRGAEAALRPAA